MDPYAEITVCKHCGLEWYQEYEYCTRCHRNFSGAEYPETFSNEEIEDREDVISIIKNAFNNVLIEDGMTIHEAHLEGFYSDESVRIAARNKDLETSWKEVPDWKLEKLYSAPFFMDKIGFRFYIHAYMIWYLKLGGNSYLLYREFIVSYLILKTENDSDNFINLDSKMSYAIYRFLKHISNFYRYNNDAIKALDIYWGKFSSPSF